MSMSVTCDNIGQSKQSFFTDERDIKRSSIVILEPESSFVLKETLQSDFYVIHGSIEVDSRMFESGDFVSAHGTIIQNPNDQPAELFLYEEPMSDAHHDFHLCAEEMEWYTNSVKGLTQCILRKNGHSLFLVRWAVGTTIPFHTHALGEEIYVLKGELFDRSSSLKKGEWKRMLPGQGHAPHTKEETLILLRNGHL